MTVYNGERYLVEAIDSMLGQTLNAFELIVIDDFSTDSTPAILSAYAAREPRVRVLRNETNLGPYPSANRGLEIARADVIARMDADDLSEPERLARQIGYLEQNPRCLLVGSGYRSIDAAGRTRFVRHNPLDNAAAAFVARLRMPMVHPSFCFRARCPDGTPVLYDTAAPVAGDFALAASLSRMGPIASLAAPLVRYRMHAGNISTTRIERQRYYARRIAERAVAAHYPQSVAAALAPLLAALHRAEPVDAVGAAGAVRGLDAALAHDFGDSPPPQVRERAAGILAEAVLGGEGNTAALWRLPGFAVHARHHLVPLAARTAQLLNWHAPPD